MNERVSTVARVDRARAEIARADPHVSSSLGESPVQYGIARFSLTGSLESARPIRPRSQINDKYNGRRSRFLV